MSKLGTHISQRKAHVCASPGEISKLYPATIAPSPYLISIYVTFVYIGQLGYCVLLVLARRPETKVDSL